MLDRNARVWVTGHTGLVGSAVIRRLQSAGMTDIVAVPRVELDLRDGRAVLGWMMKVRPQFVIHVAGKVGGILANAQYPADFLHDNVLIQATVLRGAMEIGVEKLLYLGSSCIYPRDCPQPIREDYLLTGPLEETNFGYAIAKITGLLACKAYRRQYGSQFISAMPTNLYGPHDNFDLHSSHVVPALLRRFYEAKQRGDREVVIWGTGRPLREFLHVDDLADACLFLLEHYNDEATINVGTGEEVSIRDLAELIRRTVYPEATLVFDAAKPDGTPRKLLDVSRIHALGWRHQISLSQGIRQTFEWFRRQSFQDAASTLERTP